MKILSINKPEKVNYIKNNSGVKSPDTVTIGNTDGKVEDFLKLKSFAGKNLTENYREKIMANSNEDFASLLPKDTKADIKSLLPGAGLFWANKSLGLNVGTHEIGHQSAHKILWDDYKGHIQVDATENLKNFIKTPSTDTFTKFITEYDVEENNCRGYHVVEAQSKVSEIGKNFTEDQRHAIAYAAGCTLESLPTFLAFGAGFGLRKKHPLMGYSLMTYGAITHLRTSLYPLSAAIPAVQADGGDWVSFAQLTGINPAITGAVFALSLPLFGLGLYAIEKHGENKVKDRVALGNLIKNGKISQEELEKSFSGYERKDSMIKAEEEVSAILNNPTGKINKKELKKAFAKLEKEYTGFSNSLINKHRENIKEERKNIEKAIPEMSIPQTIKNTKEDIKNYWKTDKTGFLLTASLLASSGAAVIATALKTAMELYISVKNLSPENSPEVYNLLTGTGSQMGEVASKVLPAASILKTALSAYNTVKAIKNPAATNLDKGFAAAGTIFSAISLGGLVVPGLALPLLAISMAGQIGIWGAKKVISMN